MDRTELLHVLREAFKPLVAEVAGVRAVAETGFAELNTTAKNILEVGRHTDQTLAKILADMTPPGADGAPPSKTIDLLKQVLERVNDIPGLPAAAADLTVAQLTEALNKAEQAAQAARSAGAAAGGNSL